MDIVNTKLVGNDFIVTLSDGSTNEFNLGRDVSQMIGAWCASKGVNDVEQWNAAMEEFKGFKEAFFQ